MSKIFSPIQRLFRDKDEQLAEEIEQQGQEEEPKPIDPRVNYEFTDKDRELAKAARSLQALEQKKLKDIRDRIKKLEKIKKYREMEQRLHDLESELYEAEEEEEEEELIDAEDPFSAMIQSYIMSSLNMKQQPQQENKGSYSLQHPQQQQVQQTLNNEIDLTDEEIKDILGQHSNDIKRIQKFPDSVISKLIKTHILNISDNTAQRAVGIIKKKKW